MKMKTKLFAFLAVALMMALPLAVFVPSADAGIDSNDSIDRIDDIADLQPIDLPEGFENGLDGDAMLLGDSRATGVLEGMYPGSWTWDRTTGLGPYNSFYGAFDIDNGNAFVGVLDPYNLKKLVDGTDLSADGHYSIMWVLPTVYWSVDENGNLELSNDSAKGTAYAHTIDGHVYKYVAYGVYEGTPNDDGTAPTMLTSESGKLPVVSKSRTQYQTLGISNDVSELGEGAFSMIWNFYMWSLYRYIAFTTMEDFNSQAIVGWGHTQGPTRVFDTGETDSLGPYAGNVSSSASVGGLSPVKLFLENSWGGVGEFLMGVNVNKDLGIYINSGHNPQFATEGDNIVFIEQALPTSSSSGWGSSISTNENIWGFCTVTGGSTYNTGLSDFYYPSTLSSAFVVVGGIASTNSGYDSRWGINFINADSLQPSGVLGSRLAFVFDQDPAVFTPASYDYKLNYDPTLMATTSAAISVDGMDPITHDYPTFTVTIESSNAEYGTVDVSELADVVWGTAITVDGNTLTIGETVITATPAEGYRLASWSVANGDVITSETTITATFELIPVPEPVENKLIKLIPLIVIIALTVMAAIALMSFTGNGIDLIKLLIGLTVCVLFVAMAMIPAVGGF